MTAIFEKKLRPTKFPKEFVYGFCTFCGYCWVLLAASPCFAENAQPCRRALHCFRPLSHWAMASKTPSQEPVLSAFECNLKQRSQLGSISGVSFESHWRSDRSVPNGTARLPSMLKTVAVFWCISSIGITKLFLFITPLNSQPALRTNLYCRYSPLPKTINNSFLSDHFNTHLFSMST